MPEKSEPKPVYFNDDDAAKLLMSKGLLFEINRQVLHPFGYALGVRYTDDDKFLGFFVLKTPDPSGMIFADDTFNESYPKYLAFLQEEGLKTFESRRAELGYLKQEPKFSIIKKE